jgi:acylphosphatase
MAKLIARTYRVRGRVQGVGFRFFVKHQAEALGVRGFVRNEDDGSVFAYAVADTAAIDEFSAALHRGPHLSEVRGVEVQEAEIKKLSSFRID